MKFEKTQIFNFEGAFRGMRNPKESWNLSDSWFGMCGESDTFDYDIAHNWVVATGTDVTDPEKYDTEIDIKDKWLIENGILRRQEHTSMPYYDCAFIGPKDMCLAQSLIRGGSEHRKFLRQIFVSVDITAPLYWWKEFDTYKIGTVANSTSTMHKILSKPITLDSFEMDDSNEWCIYLDDFIGEDGLSADDCESQLDTFIDMLEGLRLKILEIKKQLKENDFSSKEKNFLNKKEKFLWKELIRWLPSSWLQTRTVTLTYENLLSISKQRQNHKLNEWTGKHTPVQNSFLQWVNTLPYAQELIFYK